MSNGHPGKTRTIGNLGILDIRKASEESVTAIGTVGNIGTVLYSPETAHLMGHLGGVIGNLGKAIEVSSAARVLQGDTEFTQGYLKGKAAPVDLVVAGRVVVVRDVPVEEIESGLGELTVTGDLICPANLVEAVQSKIHHLGGSVVAYPPGARLAFGEISLDDLLLGSLGRWLGPGSGGRS